MTDPVLADLARLGLIIALVVGVVLVVVTV